MSDEAKTFSAEIKELGDKIVALTLMQAKDLVDYLKDEYDIEAAAGGAKRMFLPVVTSSLTTMAAFVPLLITGGEMGQFIVTIPTVMLYGKQMMYTISNRIA